jgi:hypothetical protein
MEKRSTLAIRRESIPIRMPSLLNPFYHDVVLIGSIDTLGLADVLRPLLWLIGFNVVTAMVGARRAAGIGQKD